MNTRSISLNNIGPKGPLQKVPMISTAFDATSQTLKFKLCAMEGMVRATGRSFGRLWELSDQALRTLLDEHSAIIAQARSSSEMATLVGLLGAAVLKATSYFRRVGAMAIEACSEIALDSEHCFSESSPQGRALVDSLLTGSFVEKLGSGAILHVGAALLSRWPEGSEIEPLL